MYVIKYFMKFVCSEFKFNFVEGDGGDSLTGISTGGVWEGGISVPSAGERPAHCWRREPPHTPESYTDIHIKYVV